MMTQMLSINNSYTKYHRKDYLLIHAQVNKVVCTTYVIYFDSALIKKAISKVLSNIFYQWLSSAGGQINACIVWQQYNQHVLYLCAGHFRVWVSYILLFILNTKYSRTKCSEQLNLGNYFEMVKFFGKMARHLS